MAGERRYHSEGAEIPRWRRWRATDAVSVAARVEPGVLEERLAAIAAAEADGDNEMAETETRYLWEDVLHAIAAGAPNSQHLAVIALQAEQDLEVGSTRPALERESGHDLEM